MRKGSSPTLSRSPTLSSDDAAPRVELLGLPIDPLTHRDVVKRVFSALQDGNGGYIMTPNLDNLRGIEHDAFLRELALSADLCVPDGMPLLWASRLRGTPLPSRIAGSDLVFTLSEAAARAHRSIFLLGGSPGTAERAADVLRGRFAGLTIAGTYCPALGERPDPDEIARIGAALRRAEPDIVFIGLPFPKASALVRAIREQFRSTWFLGCGISFSFVCGDVSRAPGWLQRLGLEWLHRLTQEPRRLFRRYMLEGVPFVATLFVSALADRRRLRRGASK